MAHCSDALRQRIESFGIEPADLTILRRQAPKIAGVIPELVARFDGLASADTWGEVSDAAFCRDRVRYWLRLTSGDVDDEFAMAAVNFGRVCFSLGIPSDTFPSRHCIGARALADWIFKPAHGPARSTWFGRARRWRAYTAALRKVVWLGVSLVLDAYGGAEAEQKSAALKIIEENFAAKIERVGQMLGEQVGELEAVVTLISGSATRLRGSSDMIVDAAARASQSASEIAASAEGLARSVGSIGARTAECALSAELAAEQAQRGGRVIERLIQSTAQIDEITQFIHQVASRTQLLSLTAAIEAASASEAGRGFALVATEVRNLALEVSGAIDRVSEKVHLVQNSTSDIAAAMHRVVERIEDFSAVFSLIAVKVGEQGEATRAIAVASQHAAIRNEDVSQITLAMRTDTEGSMELAEQLRQAAAGIGLQSTTIRNVTQVFMAEVRAAQDM